MVRIMQKIKTVNIPKIHSLYRCFAAPDEEHNNGVGSRNKEILSMWYYCANCGTTFMVKHRRRPINMFQYDYGERDVACPNCKNQSSEGSYIHDIATCINKVDFPQAWSPGYERSYQPLSVKLELNDIKNGVQLRATFRTIEMHLTTDGGDVVCNFDKHVEIINFDIKHRKTTLKFDSQEYMELGSPMDWNKLREFSMLRSLAANVLSNKSKKDKSNDYDPVREVQELVMEMRRLCVKKWKKLHGYPIKRIDTSAKMFEAGGIVLRQVHNIAFRMVYPDLASLKINEFGKTQYEKIKTILMDLDAARQAKNSIQFIIKKLKMPDKPVVRRILAQNITDALELGRALSITDNFDCNMAIYNKLHSTFRIKYRNGIVREDAISAGLHSLVYDFLEYVAPVYKATSLAKFISGIKDVSYLEDVVRLGCDFPLDKFTKPLSKMHDYMIAHEQHVLAQRRLEERIRHAESERFRKMLERLRNYDAFDLNIPEDVKKRLVMQLSNGMGRFFLPETNKDLQYTSEIMSNCVRTYEERIFSQQCNVVYYTDDAGKLLACIEVNKHNQIVQAKLKYNKYVRTNPEINKVIVDWAKAKGLEIATNDLEVDVEEEEKDNKTLSLVVA